MKSSLVSFHKVLNLPQDTSWQIHWYGTLTETHEVHKTKFIHAYLIRVDVMDNIVVKWHKDERKKVLLPITEMPILPLGSVFHKEKVLSNLAWHPRSEKLKVTLNLDRANLSVFHRIDPNSGTSPLPIPDFVEKNDPHYQSTLLKVNSNDVEEMATIFPSSTLFHFFWARSSKWAQMLTDGSFAQYEDFIFNPQFSELSDDRKSALIRLRKGVLDDDARFIATFAFDPYALKAGKDVYHHLIPTNQPMSFGCLRVLPPYQGQMTFEVFRHRVPFGDREAWLIQSIESCDYDCGIEEVNYQRESGKQSNSQESHSTAIDEINIEENQLIQGSPNKKVILSGKAYKSGIISAPLYAEESFARFPALSLMLAVKHYADEKGKESNRKTTQIKRFAAEEFSTLADQCSEETACPLGNLCANPFDTTNASSQSDNQTSKIEKFLQLAIDLKKGILPKSLVKEGWNVCVQPMLSDSKLQPNHFFLLPRGINSVAKAWRFSDESKKHLKRVFCARLHFSHENLPHRFRYLMDFEPRAEKSNSILLFWAKNDKQLSHEERKIKMIVNAVASECKTNIVLSDIIPEAKHAVRNHPKKSLDPLLLFLFDGK